MHKVFRAIDRKSKQWAYSDVVSLPAFWSAWFQGEFRSETVSQWIGLYDKAAAAIYEGDRCKVSAQTSTYVVRWDDVHAAFKLWDEALEQFSDLLPSSVEQKRILVMGNIHDHLLRA